MFRSTSYFKDIAEVARLRREDLVVYNYSTAHFPLDRYWKKLNTDSMDWFSMQYLKNKYTLSLHECVKKWYSTFDGPWHPSRCVGLPIKLPIIWSIDLCSKNETDKGSNCCTFTEKNLMFWEHPLSENYSSSPSIIKKWHISEMTKIGPGICHQLLSLVTIVYP